MRDGCALVTGAAGGIGGAIATGLAADGWPVGINYRNDSEGAERVAGRISEAGGTAVTIAGDLCANGTADTLFEQLEERFGRRTQIITELYPRTSNAGMRADGLSPQLADEQWDQVLDTNLSAAFRTTRRALRPMLKARFGRIINVASVVGMRANAGQANYAASKAGLIGFTKTVAVEVARRGVTVNAIAPGFVETKLTEGVGNGLVDAIPARRVGTPEEIAACVRFLASEEASYVTGTTLTVDGGLSA